MLKIEKVKSGFNGFAHEPVPPVWPPRVLGKEIRSDGRTVMVVRETLQPFPADLTADAFSIQSLMDAGVPIKETSDGLIPATPEEKMSSAMRYGYDLDQRVQRERAEMELKAHEEKEKQKVESNQTIE